MSMRDFWLWFGTRRFRFQSDTLAGIVFTKARQLPLPVLGIYAEQEEWILYYTDHSTPPVTIFKGTEQGAVQELQARLMPYVMV